MSGHPLLKASFCSTQKQRPSQTASDKAGQCSFSSHSGLGDYHLEFNPILFTLVVFHLFFHTDSVTFLTVVTKSPMRSSSRKEGFLLTQGSRWHSLSQRHTACCRGASLWKLGKGTNVLSLSFSLHSGTLISGGVTHIQHGSSFLCEATLETSSKHAQTCTS